MTFFQVKTLLAVLLVAAGVTAALSMLTLMGKTERKLGVMTLRNTHRVAGYTFAILLVVLAAMGLGYLGAAKDTLPLRGVLHWTLGSLLVFLLLLKLAVVRVYKQFLKFVPVMGMMVITLTLVVATLSAVFFVVTGGLSPAPGVTSETESAQPVTEKSVDAAAGTAELGRATFATYCNDCHNSNSQERKVGPGLAGLFDRDALTIGDKPVTRENVRGQIVTPAGTMPSFGGFLSDEQLSDVVAYLETL